MDSNSILQLHFSCAYPAFGSDMLSMPIEEELIPAGEMAIHRGASVEATDGHIGKVEEFIVDPKDKHITNLVLQEGHLWHKRELILPISAIARMDEDYIYLKLDKAAVRSLQTVPLQQLERTPE